MAELQVQLGKMKLAIRTLSDGKRWTGLPNPTLAWQRTAWILNLCLLLGLIGVH